MNGMMATGSRRRPVRRGLPGQKDRREVERTVRRTAVAFARWLRRHDRSTAEAARQLSMAPATLRTWRRRWREDRMTIRIRGRPAERADRARRQEILALFGLLGPHLGLPTLEDLFPDVARGELVELQRRYRYAYRRRYAVLLHVLRWTQAGAVWAMDFAEPPTPIDGLYRWQFVVRDLASGYQLLALPALGETTRIALDGLRALFAWHGPPLVLKHDNGSSFTSTDMQAFLRQHDVLQLVSPGGTPAYNGSIEAGIGSLKTRAHYEAARHDRPGEWTCDDLEAARSQANETARPRGLWGPTPDEAWSFRFPVAPADRAALRASYDFHQERERHHRGLEASPLHERTQASIDRIAIGRALIDEGYLLVRRRRISPPISRRQAVKIS